MSGALAWGVAAQVKAERVALETFVAWHLDLGATRVVIYFDDPDDPGAALLAGLGPRVVSVRCDAAHWAGFGKRPGKKTARQTMNVQHAYDRTDLDWLAHVDVDEFILPVVLPGEAVAPSVAARLAAVPPDAPFVRMRPYEALAQPDGSPPRHFRAPPPGHQRDQVVRRIYGDAAQGLVGGMLSHAVGKGISRRGVAGLAPRIHVPRLHGEGVQGVPFLPGLVMLHYHATDRAHWLAQLAYRTELGAYSARPQNVAFFQAATPADLNQFYDRVQIAHPQLLAGLQMENLLLTHDPQLEAVRARTFGGAVTS